MLEIGRSWVDGWAVSRRAARPVDVPWGLRIEVGQPTQVVRHVLFDADVEMVRGLIGTVNEPTTCIKAFLEPGDMEPWFSSEWEPAVQCFLMAVDLRPSGVRTPDGYTATTETADGVTSVRILAADGQLAASGQAGLTDAACVFDQIATEKAHQRLGLGTVVMGVLTNAALDRGVSAGILGATIEGRALYETLGWRGLAPLNGFVYKPTVSR